MSDLFSATIFSKIRAFDTLNKLPDFLIKYRIAAKISKQELAPILGINPERLKKYEDTDYQCASFVEILQVSIALGVEFETAAIRVDFQEIKAVQKTLEKWRKEKVNLATDSPARSTIILSFVERAGEPLDKAV
ncbi:helix-turn-helix domain-containing protein [Oscillatoria nigro-viridis]|uniref:helix-turn-helix domain-containing protein n=1 Tax=Phormidium nigroviride TaxID=482564 RepID=UPI00031F87E1|nr:helix-turn-helix transcriptional regulator [Oscillatoria nigro-viridis]